MKEAWRSTTIVAVRHRGEVAMAGDGQVSLGQTVMKKAARKVRPIADGRVLTGFAGATADAFALLERFESKLQAHPASLQRATVELAKDWRTDRYLRRLEAMLIVMDKHESYVVSGTGDVVAPDDGLLAIGSGGAYALSAARALVKHSDLGAAAIAEEALHLAADICVYTNHDIVVETLEAK